MAARSNEIFSDEESFIEDEEADDSFCEEDDLEDEEIETVDLNISKGNINQVLQPKVALKENSHQRDVLRIRDLLSDSAKISVKQKPSRYFDAVVTCMPAGPHDKICKIIEHPHFLLDNYSSIENNLLKNIEKTEKFGTRLFVDILQDKSKWGKGYFLTQFDEQMDSKKLNETFQLIQKNKNSDIEFDKAEMDELESISSEEELMLHFQNIYTLVIPAFHFNMKGEFCLYCTGVLFKPTLEGYQLYYLSEIGSGIKFIFQEKDDNNKPISYRSLEELIENELNEEVLKSDLKKALRLSPNYPFQHVVAIQSLLQRGCTLLQYIESLRKISDETCYKEFPYEIEANEKLSKKSSIHQLASLIRLQFTLFKKRTDLLNENIKLITQSSEVLKNDDDFNRQKMHVETALKKVEDDLILIDKRIKEQLQNSVPISPKVVNESRRLLFQFKPRGEDGVPGYPAMACADVACVDKDRTGIEAERTGVKEARAALSRLKLETM